MLADLQLANPTSSSLQNSLLFRKKGKKKDEK